jgi:hypothetical protein
VLDAKPFVAGATEPCLHLITDEDPAVFPYDLGGTLEVSGLRHDVSPNALDGLGHERGWLPVGHGENRFFEVGGKRVDTRLVTRDFERTAVRIRRFDMLDTRDAAGAGTPTGMTRQVGGHGAPAGVSVSQHNDLAPPGIHAGQHDGRLHRLRARVGEERLLEIPGGNPR